MTLLYSFYNFLVSFWHFWIFDNYIFAKSVIFQKKKTPAACTQDKTKFVKKQKCQTAQSVKKYCTSPPQKGVCGIQTRKIKSCQKNIKNIRKNYSKMTYFSWMDLSTDGFGRNPEQINQTKIAGEGSDLRYIHLWAKWRVMKNPDFSKNPDFFNFSGGRGYKIDALIFWKHVWKNNFATPNDCPEHVQRGTKQL